MDYTFCQGVVVLIRFSNISAIWKARNVMISINWEKVREDSKILSWRSSNISLKGLIWLLYILACFCAWGLILSLVWENECLQFYSVGCSCLSVWFVSDFFVCFSVWARLLSSVISVWSSYSAYPAYFGRYISAFVLSLSVFWWGVSWL